VIISYYSVSIPLYPPLIRGKQIRKIKIKISLVKGRSGEAERD
jgi:hypothetical protein